MVRKPYGELLLPPEMLWLNEHIDWCQTKARYADWFTYVTVRHGPVTSVTDDLWHVDGFSMRIPHPPQTSFVWALHSPAQYLVQPIVLPSDFDALKHNLHWYFQDVADEANVVDGLHQHVYQIDPYVIHRRPVLTGWSLGWRSMVRVSFVPIEIVDDNCTVNSLIPAHYYGSADFRGELSRYPVK